MFDLPAAEARIRADQAAHRETARLDPEADQAFIDLQHDLAEVRLQSCLWQFRSINAEVDPHDMTEAMAMTLALVIFTYAQNLGEDPTDLAFALLAATSHDLIALFQDGPDAVTTVRAETRQ